MGGSGSKSQITKINDSEWKIIANQDGAEIVRNNIGQTEGQIRVIPVDPKHERNKQLSIYNYRRNCDSPLVRCLGANFSQSDQKTFCGNQQNVRVLTQRIPKRLQDFNTLSFPQSLYILSQCFEGFQDLTEKAGIFEITNRMIGVNNNGEVKVWLNQNFATNHPTFQKPILQTTMTTSQLFTQKSTEQKMIETVMDLVESKTQNGKYPEDFKLTMRNNKNFYDAYNKLHEYIKNKALFVPARLPSGQNTNKGFTSKTQVNKRIQNIDRNTYQSNYNYNQSDNKNFSYISAKSQYGPTQNQVETIQNQPVYTGNIPETINQPITSITTIPNTMYHIPPPTSVPISVNYVGQPYQYGAFSPKMSQMPPTVIRMGNSSIPMSQAYPSPVSPKSISFNYQARPGSQFVRQY